MREVTIDVEGGDQAEQQIRQQLRRPGAMDASCTRPPK
jgi:hypothetical protein